jgi:hypothetical protein
MVGLRLSCLRHCTPCREQHDRSQPCLTEACLSVVRSAPLPGILAAVAVSAVIPDFALDAARTVVLQQFHVG